MADEARDELKELMEEALIVLEAHGDTARPFATVSYFARASDNVKGPVQPVGIDDSFTHGQDGIGCAQQG